MFNNTKTGIKGSYIQQINRQILYLALPSILANITVPLVGIVDTAIVGHLSDAVAIGGIAIGTMLFDLLYWNFSFLRSGTGGLTAQAYGRKDSQAQADLLTQALFIALLAALAIWLIQWLYVSVVLMLVPCSNEVADFARKYFFIRIWAAPATLSCMAIKGWLIGMQNTVGAMICDLTINITNIILSYILAYHTAIGIMGVAWGTLIAQYAGMIVGLSIIGIKYKDVVKLYRFREACSRKSLKRIISLNANLVIRSLCMLIIYVGFTSIAANYGNEELALSSIMMKLFLLFSYFIDGFAYAGEALTGKHIGAKEKGKLSVIITWLFVWTIAIGLVFTIIYGALGTQTVSLLTSDQSVIKSSGQYIIWLILMPLVSCAAFMWDGIFIGATAGKEIRNSMIWAAVGFITTYAICNRFCGIHALYAAYFVHLVARFVYLSITWKRVYKLIN